ncbi:MAG: hypothetical protein M9964_08085 [Solirubrobacterales bacterium]|nr:hypothetical protein [Solirubrobacterales bacterium]
MCRLFALHAGRTDVRVLALDAPDSIARQSESNKGRLRHGELYWPTA